MLCMHDNQWTIDNVTRKLPVQAPRFSWPRSPQIGQHSIPRSPNSRMNTLRFARFSLCFLLADYDEEPMQQSSLKSSECQDHHTATSRCLAFYSAWDSVDANLCLRLAFLLVSLVINALTLSHVRNACVSSMERFVRILLYLPEAVVRS